MVSVARTYQSVVPELLSRNQATHDQVPVQLVEAWGAVQERRLRLQVRVQGDLGGGPQGGFNVRGTGSAWATHLLQQALQKLLAFVALRECLLPLSSEVEVELSL